MSHDPFQLLATLRREFAASPYAAIRRLACDYSNGRLLLAGRLPNFHTRQVAINLVARHASTATELEDHIEVCLPV
jgi:hypothetical protein